MNDPSAALQCLGTALDSGDRDAVLACFAPGATLSVVSREERFPFTGPEIREAIDLLMSGFDDIKVTATTRQVTASRVVQESVFSGEHTGNFAGAEPTSARVHVNVKLSATAGPDSTLKSLWVEADTRALFAQITGNDDPVGATGALVAAARQRYEGAVRVIDGTRPTPPVAAVVGGRPGSRRRWVSLVAAAALVLAVSLVWRPGSGSPAIDAAANHPVVPIVATSGPTPAPTKPSPTKPAPSPKPQATVLPVIATPAPKAVPTVQKGRQVVLNSDVLFAFDSSALSPRARAAVTTLAKQILSAGVTGRIQINGYTDNRGSKAYCLALSRARALAVAQVLQAGLAGRPVTLAPQGFGQANPIAPNTTDPNRARNRRVTIVLPTVR